MKLKVTITMDTAAFDEENSGPETARILRDLADECDGRRISAGIVRRLRDVNGNEVGEARVTR